MTSSLTRRLARILSRPVDQSWRSRAALHVLDWLGCAIAGTADPTGQLILKWAERTPHGKFSVIGTAPAATPEPAVFVNGGLGNILEMDDVHRTAILHPGPVVVPAALAAAQEAEATAGEFLDAVVRGYEAEIRIGTAVGPGHYANWHNTATCGPFGAAAAAGSIMKLDEDRMVWALGNAGTQSSGFWRCRHEPVMSKQLHTARASHAGFVAASLAASGFTGPEYVLEGEQGFFQAMCPDPAPELILANDGNGWKIGETSFKPWPACRHAHAAIDAALVIREQHAPPPDGIASIHIRTYCDALSFCDRQTPSSPAEARFSLQHAVAVVLAAGAPSLDDFEPAAIKRPRVSNLRRRATVASTGEFANRYPQHFGSGVDVVMKDHRVFTADVHDALGDPENPLPEERLIHKVHQLMLAAGMTDCAAAALIDAALALTSGGNLDRLAANLAATGPLARQDRVG